MNLSDLCEDEIGVKFIKILYNIGYYRIVLNYFETLTKEELCHIILN